MSFRLKKIQMPNINLDTRRLFEEATHNRNSAVTSSKPQQQQRHEQEQQNVPYFDSIDNDINEALGNNLTAYRASRQNSTPANLNFTIPEEQDEENSFVDLNDENIDENFNILQKLQTSKKPSKNDNTMSLNTPLSHSHTNNHHDSPPSISINNEYGDLFIDQQDFEPSPKTTIETTAKKSTTNAIQKLNRGNIQYQSQKERSDASLNTNNKGDDDELMVLEVQKFSSSSSTKPFKKPENVFSKPSNKIPVAKTKSFGAVGKNLHSSSDKFLDPLLASISKIQMEKNAIQSEYGALNIKYSRASTQLEKTLNAVAALKRRVEGLVNVQEELQNDLSNIRNGPYAQISSQIKELKSDNSSIDEAIKELGSNLSSTRSNHEKLASKLSTIKNTQSHIDDERIEHATTKARLEAALLSEEKISQKFIDLNKEILSRIESTNSAIKSNLKQSFDPVNLFLSELKEIQQQQTEKQNTISKEYSDSMSKLENQLNSMALTQKDKSAQMEILLSSLKDTHEKNLTTTIENLETLITSQKVDFDPLREFISTNYDTHIKAIMDQIVFQFSSFKQLKISEEIESLSKQLMEKSASINKLQSDLDDAIKVNTNLSEEIRELKYTNDTTVADLKTEKMNKDATEKEMNELKEKLRKSDDSAKVFQLREKKLHQEFEMEKKNISKSSNARVKDLLSQIDILKQENNRMNIEVESLRLKTEGNSEIAIKLAVLERENELITNQISEKNFLISTLENRIKELDYEVLMCKDSTPITSTPKKSSKTSSDKAFEESEAFLRAMPIQKQKPLVAPQTPIHKKKDEDHSSRFLITPHHVPVVKRHREVEVVYTTQPGLESGSMLKQKRARTRQNPSKS